MPALLLVFLSLLLSSDAHAQLDPVKTGDASATSTAEASPQANASRWLEQVRALLDAQQLAMAAQEAEKLAAYATQQQLLPTRIALYHLQAKIAAGQDQTELVQQYLQEGLALAQQAALPEAVAEFQFRLGEHAFAQAQHDVAIRHLKSALLIMERSSVTETMLKAYRIIGLSYKAKAEFGLALAIFEKAQQAAAASGNTPMAIGALNLQASVYSDMGNHAQTIELALAAYRQAVATDDKRNAIISKNNLGITYNEMKQYDKAIGHLEDALANADALGNKGFTAAILNNIAESHLALRNLPAALAYNQQSLAIEVELGNNAGISISKNNIADIQILLGNAAEALELLNEAMVLEQMLDEDQRKVELLTSLVQAHIGVKDAKAAIATANQCINDASRQQLDKLLLGCLLAASEAEALGKNYATALARYQAYSALQEKLLNDQSTDRIAELEVMHKTTVQKQEIDLLKHEASLKALEAQSDRNAKIYLSISLTLLLLLVLFILSRYRLRVKVAREINEKNQALQEAYQKLEAIAKYDALTGVYSRRALQDLMEHEHIRSKRGDRQLHILLLDVDHFKSVNDRYGHDVGDAVLIAVCNSIKQAIREQDIFGRWGGEEFLLCLPETPANGALVVAEAVRKRVAETVVKAGGSADNASLLSVTVSIGVTGCGSQLTLEAAIKRADEALYRAKREGRNRVINATPAMTE